MTKAIRFTQEQVDEIKNRFSRTEPPPAAPTPRPVKPKGGPNRLEVAFLAQIKAAGLPLPCAQYHHIPNREFRLDFAYPEIRLGIECQGGVHRLKDKHARDIEKRALGLLHGWIVLEVDSVSVDSGMAVSWLKTLMGMQGHPT